MNMKSLKTQFIAAIAMVLVAAIAMGGATYAWFALNDTVTVTGMTVTTQVSNNLLIAPATGTGTNAMPAANLYRTQYVASVDGLLEPVSSINGTDGSFFYTLSNNVNADGDAIADTYVAYDASDRSGFKTNYGITSGEAYGYVDYVFALQATNTSSTNKYNVNMTKCDLHYYPNTATGSDTTENAFRIAVLVQDGGDGGASAANTTVTSNTVLASTATAADAQAQYFTSGKALVAASGTTHDSVAGLASAAKIATVDAGTQKYYKVTVRIWLEGEDKTCTSATFANLTAGNWNLDLEIKLEDGGADGSTAGTVKSNYTKATHTAISLSGYSADTTKNITLKDNSNNDAVYAAYVKDGATTYYKNGTRWFSIAGNAVYEITEYVTNDPTIVPVP